MNNVERSKVKYKTSDMSQYIKESRYSEGLEKLSEILEVTKILEKIGGNIDVYNKMITSFYSRNKNVREELRIKFEADYRGFRNRMHGIRTSSGNIGADEILTMSSTIEAAVNIGNKTYVRDNLPYFLEKLQETVVAIGEYLEFIDANKGMTDAEFAEQASPEANDNNAAAADAAIAETIDQDILRDIGQKAAVGDSDGIIEDYEKLCNFTYAGENIDFMNALRESIENGDYAAISEMVDTYINLKS
jgi:HPt (histidine-containing phosphotransfer) domain-containing protein